MTQNDEKFNVLHECKVKAEILEIGDEELTKELKDGKQGKYLRCSVRFTEGALAGEEFWANRTLGEDKAEITVGQNVSVYLRFLERKQDGKQFCFGEISTSTKADAGDLLSKLRGA
jgi:hypothetical protein